MPGKITLVSDVDILASALAARLARCGEVAIVPADFPGDAANTANTAAHAAGVVVYRPRQDGSGGPDLALAAGVLRRLAATRPARLVLLSSAQVYEPGHNHPGLTAEPPALFPHRLGPLARSWAELENLALENLAVAAGGALTILRPTAVAAPDSPDFLSRRLRRRLAGSLPGFDPAVQFLAPADLAEAVALAVLAVLTVERGDPGVYNVAPAGAVPVRAAMRLAGARRLPLPAFLQPTTSPEELAFLRYPATISGGRARRELGFVPRWTSAQAVVAAAGGDPEAAPAFDDHGMSERYIRSYGRTLFRFLHDVYWRIEWQGMENVPREGRAVLTGVHRGFMPWDGVMALHLLGREIGRYPRFLLHPCLVKLPFLANYMTKLGGILACQENADRVLSRGEILGMFPEGINGAFTMYRDAYKLGKFGRDEYVRMALRNRAPIVPFVTVGSAEIYPILGRLDWKWVKRTTEWLFLPLCPNFPFPGLPLPSKWHTRFLPPIHVEERYGPEAAEDPTVVREISREVRGRMEEAIAGMLQNRRSIFYGSVFGGEASR
jgi:1-acyl-sn-glycerol-3-phosphate acyltransferase/nucleoside-diphosphate-sugar epimerase